MVSSSGSSVEEESRRRIAWCKWPWTHRRRMWRLRSEEEEVVVMALGVGEESVEDFLGEICGRTGLGKGFRVLGFGGLGEKGIGALFV